jgi:hypothetical protein
MRPAYKKRRNRARAHGCCAGKIRDPHRLLFSDRAVPDYRSVIPFQDTRPSCIRSTHDSHQRLRALNGYRTEQHPDCSFRNRLVFRNRLLVGENPPPIKKTSSQKGDRANSADRRPNPTRNFENLAHYLPPLICYLHTLREHLWYTCAEGFLVTSSQLGQMSLL